MASAATRLLFLGTNTVVPGARQDTACLLVNGDLLVDTGWNAAVNMLAHGGDPMAVDYLLITHCHQDHTIGLPQLLFYHGMRHHERPAKPPLVIVGPRPDIGLVVERALMFLQADRYPEVATPPRVVALQPGDACDVGRYQVTTCPTIHPVVGLCYRLRDRLSGATVAVTGDTAYHEPLARHVAGVDALVHEASCGPGSIDPNSRWGHSGAPDAARIASLAAVRRLYLTHYPPAQRDAVLGAARAGFAESYAPVEGDAVELPAP